MSSPQHGRVASPRRGQAETGADADFVSELVLL